MNRQILRSSIVSRNTTTTGDDNYDGSCSNCDNHGFPCLNCAEYVFEGILGPGYAEQERVMPIDVEPRVRQIMIEVTKTKNIEYIDGGLEEALINAFDDSDDNNTDDSEELFTSAW